MRIEDYALIGDCQTAALVGRNGSIDWLCWPRFDSAACFAALLGGPENGYWKIAPAKGEFSVSRRYLPDTLILETEFETAEGTVTLLDFMPVRTLQSDLVRMVVGKRGRVAMESEGVLRFDYGASVPWVTLSDGGKALRAVAGPDLALLCSPVPLENAEGKTRARFEVNAGETFAFVLTYTSSHLEISQKLDPQNALKETEAFWKRWSARCSIGGEWASPVRRSLITLKALTYAPTGGIVAAPTTSLPERIGGVRNWDYRYCWLRDATLTLLALMDAGYYDEARAWREWLVRAVAGQPAADADHVRHRRRAPPAGVRGAVARGLRRLEAGARRQRRRGAAAARRVRRADRYALPGLQGRTCRARHRLAAAERAARPLGESLDRARRGPVGSARAAAALHPLEGDGLGRFRPRGEDGRGLRRAGPGRKVARAARQDPRGRLPQRLQPHAQRFRAELRLAGAGREPASHPALRAFCRSRIRACNPRSKRSAASSTVDGLVQRYRTHEGIDGLPPGEGVFLACSFWLADNLCMQGRWDEAHELFERLVGLANDVGLLAEEYDPAGRRMLGNFPQAFSHVALVNTAMNLYEREKPAEQRAEKKAA